MQIIAGLSKVLYHTTSVGRILTMLQTNEIRLSRANLSVKSVEEPLQKGYPYFLSTARTLLSSYLRYAKAYIVLDGDKLAQNYKGQSVDYWSDIGTEIKSTRNTEYLKHSQDNSNEAEDRIYSKKPYIPNAVKYIKAIYLIMDNDFDGRGKKQILELLLEAKKKRIPVSVFKSQMDIRTRKAIPMQEVLDKLKSFKHNPIEVPSGGLYEYHRYRGGADKLFLIKIPTVIKQLHAYLQDTSIHVTWTDYLGSLGYNLERDYSYKDDIIRMLYRAMWDQQDFISSFDCDLFNMKSNPDANIILDKFARWCAHSKFQVKQFPQILINLMKQVKEKSEKIEAENRRQAASKRT